MSTFRNAVNIDVWSVGKLIDATSMPARGNEVVTIPEFQRRLVWSKKKQAELIASIRKGYPFGSIMMYEDSHATRTAADGRKYFSLIDGLQRSHALRSYVRNQNSFYNRALLREEVVEKVASGLGRASKLGKARVGQTLVKWVNSIPSFEARDGWSATGLTSELIQKVLNFQPGTQNFQQELSRLIMDFSFQQLLGGFLDATSEEARSILDVKVPVMFYNGAPEHVPDVFRLLNSKGAQLNRYEILAAQWVNQRHLISNHEIVEAIWMKNQAVIDEGLNLEVGEIAHDEESKRTRSYSLYDYLFGLGQILPQKFPRLFREAKGDRPNSDSFNLLTACFGLPSSHMGDLPTKLAGLDISTVEECVLQSVRFVDQQLEPILNLKQHGRTKFPIYHSELMIVALIATAFQARFGVRELSENDGWYADRKTLKRHIPMYYLYEILQDDWRGSGDSKLFDRVRDFRYLRQLPPDANRWMQTLENWYYDSQIDLVHDKDRVRHVYDRRPEYLLLRYLFVRHLRDSQDYHVEHIMPTSYLQQTMQQDEQWPISSIGNLALMKHAGDLKFNHLPYTRMLWQRRQDGEITANEFNTQMEWRGAQLICPAQIIPDTLSKKSYEDFLQERFEILKVEFLRAWSDHIPRDPAS